MSYYNNLTLEQISNAISSEVKESVIENSFGDTDADFIAAVQTNFAIGIDTHIRKLEDSGKIHRILGKVYEWNNWYTTYNIYLEECGWDDPEIGKQICSYSLYKALMLSKIKLAR